jgi:hypothetical protein
VPKEKEEEEGDTRGSNQCFIFGREKNTAFS